MSGSDVDNVKNVVVPPPPPRPDFSLSQHTSGARITCELLNEKNFAAWSRSIRLFLGGKGKSGWLLGTITKPNATDPKFVQWEIDNCTILGWLFNSMEPRIYHSRWEKLAQYEPLSEFTTEGGIAACHLDRQHTYQFLMGLKPEFEALCTQIVNTTPMPSIFEAFAMLDGDERRHRLLQLSPPPVTESTIPDQMALAASGSRFSGGRSSSGRVLVDGLFVRFVEGTRIRRRFLAGGGFSGSPTLPPVLTSDPCHMYSRRPPASDPLPQSSPKSGNISPISSPVLCRYPTRDRRPPDKLGFSNPNATKHSIAQYVSYQGLSDSYRTFIGNVSSAPIPRSVSEALRDPIGLLLCSAGTEGFDHVPPSSSGCNSFGRYEIALLCLGMMHFHFGHPREALEVLTEAVRVSQQHSDDTCLAYTLAAICNLLSEVGISGISGILGTSYSAVTRVGTSLSIQQQLFVLLRRSLKRAESLKLKRLVASNHVAMAKFDLTHVQRPLLSFGPKASMKLRTCPINVCKELRLSSHLISDFGSENSPMIIDGAFSTAWLKNFHKPMGSLVFSQDTGSGRKSDAFHFCAQPSSIPASVLQSVGSSYLVRSNCMGDIWQGLELIDEQVRAFMLQIQLVVVFLLLAPLARINALVYATCFADSSSLADAALAYTKLVQHLAVFKGYKVFGPPATEVSTIFPEGHVTPTQTTFAHNVQPGSLSTPMLHGLGYRHKSTEAFAAFTIAEEKFLSISKSRILLLKLQLLHERALHCGHLKLAQQLCDELGVLASSVNGVDMELKTEGSLRHARTLLAANQFSQAAAVAHSLFCMCYKFNMQIENAMILLLLAEIHKRSGNAVLGIPYALASLSFCQSFNLDLLKASATLTLAELWLSLGSKHAKRALTLIHCAFPMILGHGGLELRARAFIAEAKCYLSNPSFSVFEDSQVVLDPLTQAAEELQYLEYHELAAEAFYLMAIIFDKLGQLEQREEAATSFKKHMIALENPQDQEDPLFVSVDSYLKLSKIVSIFKTLMPGDKSEASLVLGQASLRSLHERLGSISLTSNPTQPNSAIKEPDSIPGLARGFRKSS
ncbi:hypothetical protein Acr_00g0058640 [Actinidia rufa]|uniref:Anaphase-promoting complex subunit 5 n=1 Tax=Actinidia rufa TaxID=165716 RepID=A0A7J0DMW5_9ERIC|nr:hypothetical protein Acr_00g0058640 [Actinidia rufa]